MAKTLLILTANPKTTDRLRLDYEFHEIDEGLRRSKRRDDFEIRVKLAVRPDDVYRALLDFRPEIVHFAGHGAGKDGIILEDNLGNPCFVSGEALSETFDSFPEIECVVLNACYTEIQAEAISQRVGYVVGMINAVSDDAATAFSVAFYETIGAGHTYKQAHKVARSALGLQNLSEDLLPRLIENPESIERNKKYKTQRQQENLWYRYRQEEEFSFLVWDVSHKYAEKVVMEVLSRLAQAQVSFSKSEPPNLAGQWHGIVDGQEQTIEISQMGTAVYVRGIAQGDGKNREYKFRAEGRIISNVLVFSWKISDNEKGINVMSVLGAILFK